MENLNREITCEVTVNVTVEKIWKLWTTPADIIQWNNPSADWHSPRVEIDLKNEGRFFFRMEKKDGSFGFDHTGKYDQVINHEHIEYTGVDGRKSTIKFIPNGNETMIVETFEPDVQTPLETQKDFCQAILNNFKKYAEEEK